MSTTAPTLPRKAYRDSEDVILGGVAAGLARHLGVPVLAMRVGFLLATLLAFLGPMLYVGLWFVLPSSNRFEVAAPGVESATRTGRRPGARQRLTDVGPVIALAALGVGVLLALQALFGGGAVFWPVVLAVGGLALLWRQADEAQRQRWLDATGRIDPLRLVLGTGWGAWVRIVAGFVLLLAAGLVMFLDNGAMRADGWGFLVAAVLVLVGIGVVVGPMVSRLADDLSAEREQRIRTEERADVAAHLHDSVLQTLALIQRNADDPATVARLARAQERDLRTWLYADSTDASATIAAALREAAARVEDAHGITVDVVVVGDGSLTETIRPVVAATGEAITNAAKHAGTDRVDVYAEITQDAVDVFVRDRGKGFDPERIPSDRHGVRGSIVERMRRHGGRAEVRSGPGEGTEVRLHLPREDEKDGDERRE